MSESNPTKDELSAELATARADNAALRAQLAAGGGPRVYQAPHTFVLSEGDRQELELHGVANINGKLMTREQVLDLLSTSDTQKYVEIAEPSPAAQAVADATVARAAAGAQNIRGVTFVYPSVADGVIDPAVAGTPGINGPAAEPADLADEGPVDAVKV